MAHFVNQDDACGRLEVFGENYDGPHRTITLEQHVGLCLEVNFETGEITSNLPPEEALYAADMIFGAFGDLMVEAAEGKA